ncbi:RNA-directed DNA polymerase, eukaryota, reverse transcriptase zinc-binding domain protein, partial [Tanacetum coccineum]
MEANIRLGLKNQRVDHKPQNLNPHSYKSEKLEDDLCENGPLDKEEGEIPNNDVNEEDEYVKNTQWSDDVANPGTKQDNFSSEHLTSPIVKTAKEDSSSISKPPGFEAYNSNSNRFSFGGNRQSPKQPSHFSSAPAKSSRVSKSQTKSFGNHGSMIEAFVSHIEMGKVLGYDMEGSKNDLKKFIDSLGAKQVSFLGIQETHSIILDTFKIKCAWGNSQFDFVEHPASGRSGGLVSIWDPNVFSNINEFQFENLLIVEGIWIASRIHCFMINVYAPQDDSKKEKLWNDIFDFMNSNRGHHLIFGDFNVVRFASERFGTAFNHASANVFNQFIRDAHLWDIPLGGHLFTRFNKHGDKLSKIDCFLTSDSFAPLLQKFSDHVLDCLISDHRPILLSPVSNDFGPTPFKFYNSWLLDKSLHSTITDFWDNYSPMNHANPIVSFKNKMKALKVVIKDWNLKRKGSLTREKEDLTKKIKDFNANIVTRSTDFSVDFHRASWIDRLRDIDLKENIDASQKAKIKWGIEADKNSKFFHAIVNQKRRYLSIQGIKVEGLWIEDPTGIKDAFLTFFEKKFQKIDVVKIVNRSPFYKSINSDQNTYLASPISESEIKDAIWDCGSDKSPGPDGFTFAFYKEFWNVVKRDVLAFVRHFFKTGILPRGCNTSFITLISKVLSPMVISDFRPISLIGAQYKIIAKVLANRLARVIDTIISLEQSAFIKHRQILDGPLMVNEVIQWCKRKKSKLMVFEIDFEKGFDTISWDFLFQVLHFMGFNETWIKWISGCLHSASTSILINGSPTCEFNIHRGLRQGDPLSPFLFIIAIEGLHVAME